MVALNSSDRPVPVPPVIAETADQRRRMAAAKIRRQQRKILEAAIKRSEDALSRASVLAVSEDFVRAEAE